MSQYTPDNVNQMSFLDLVWKYKFYLVFYFFAVSFISFTALYIANSVPEELRVLDEKLPEQVVQAGAQATSTATTTTATHASTATKSEYPVRVIITKIGVDTSVSNPASSDNSVLNDALMRGAVRYPGSGTLGQGNMFIFGHSTGIRVVNNQAYKAFNNIKDLEVGDVILVQSIDTQYNYKVTKVSLVDSNVAMVDFSKNTDMLTLSTCDVFGKKQDRYVVEAVFVKSTTLI
jgi:LPXTG-site transpeptidase (sortase) family protein